MTEAAVSLGVDVGGSSVKAVLMRDGAVVGEGASGAYARPGADEIRAAVDGAVGQCRAAG